MRCPKCGYQKTEVVDSRDHGAYVRRRRSCPRCDERYQTREEAVSARKHRRTSH